MNNRDNKKNNKNSPDVIIFTIAAIILINIIDSGNFGALFFAIIFIGIFISTFLVIKSKISKANVEKNGGGTAKSSFQSQNNSQMWKKHSDPEAAVTEKVYAPRHETAPQKQCYDSSDVFDNYERDKQQRIEQLDVFLKNGIIEREEYHILKEKYQRNQ